jgi:hypothetical protein
MVKSHPDEQFAVIRLDRGFFRFSTQLLGQDVHFNFKGCQPLV